MNLPDRGQFISLHGDRAGPRPCIVRLWSGHSPRILRRSLQVSPAQVQRALLIRKHEDASCRACPGTGRKRPQAGILALALLGRIGLALTVHLVFPFCSSVERGCASHSPRRNSLKEKSAPTAAPDSHFLRAPRQVSNCRRRYRQQRHDQQNPDDLDDDRDDRRRQETECQTRAFAVARTSFPCTRTCDAAVIEPGSATSSATSVRTVTSAGPCGCRGMWHGGR